jgi:hypothetical protein
VVEGYGGGGEVWYLCAAAGVAGILLYAKKRRIRTVGGGALVALFFLAVGKISYQGYVEEVFPLLQVYARAVSQLDTFWIDI